MPIYEYRCSACGKELEALQKLEAEHPDKAQLVKLRYFAGLNLEEAAAAAGISRATAERRWAYARDWW